MSRLTYHVRQHVLLNDSKVKNGNFDKLTKKADNDQIAD